MMFRFNVINQSTLISLQAMLVFQFIVALGVLGHAMAESAAERAVVMLAQMNTTEKFAMM